MFLARVVGNVVANRKYEGTEGFKLMLIQPLGDDQQPKGVRQVAVDTVRAGEGDVVTCVGSREAALACNPTFVPVDCAIIGIIDELDTSEA
ncbi:MAG: ethanolamine utilization protein EutN [Myxococcales bacterium]|nr:ethanolamine utilization protein EutN [Myxococcales bacterium]|tara:strand:- start:3217 stop:3489 length:273 start_codon:yes stop_codon:yes gene_type:complete